MEHNTQITLIVPVKPLAFGKSRLAGLLSSSRRRALSLMMLHRVIRCVSSTKNRMNLWVVGGDSTVEGLCKNLGVKFLEEIGSDLNETVGRAFLRAISKRSCATIYLPADLPALETADLDALVEASEGLTKLVLVPAERDGGTNAIVAPRNLGFPLQLGENSFLRHLELARLTEWDYSIYQSPGISFDLDTPEDFEACKSRAPWLFQDLSDWEDFLESIENTGLAQKDRSLPGRDRIGSQQKNV